MMVEKRIGSLIRMDVESETKSCSSLLWDELDLLNYAIVVLYCTISRCVCSPSIENQGHECFACIRGCRRENAS